MSNPLDTVEKNIIEGAENFHQAFGDQYSVPQYLFLVLQEVAYKIYEAAPSCKDAESLINQAIQSAKEMFLEE